MLASKPTNALAADYLQGLARYLASADEAALTGAYELGRRALNQGFGLIDWATLHDDTVAALQLVDGGPDALARAAQFFRESLSPYEMTQRGYVETNSWLERLNLELRNEIAQKEKLAAQLVDSNNALEAFSYSVAHDLRAPLRGIEGFSKILLEGEVSPLPHESRGYLDRINRAAIRMSDLIDGLLALSRVMGGELQRQPVDLAVLGRAIVLALREANPGRDVVTEIAPSLPVEGDRRLLDVVLQNLLGNAWKFTQKTKDAHIEVGVQDEATPPVYFVRDNGAGFDMTYAKKLFGVFQRLHPDSEFPGTGIGLATVERIIRRHGGRIWADSSVGEGAVFFFTVGASAFGRQTP
jgi:signal transduction histidine kinase